jgi:type I restriction-modification system DNA methylase subunit
LLPEHIKKIVDTYRHRAEEDRYSLRVPMERIGKEGFNLNISRYISTAQAEENNRLEGGSPAIGGHRAGNHAGKRQAQRVS